MTEPLTYLAATLDAAQRDAEAANGRYWVDAEGDDDATAWVMNEDMHLFETDPATARHAASNSPQATLRRIAADRKNIKLHEGPHECSSYDWMSQDINSCMWVTADEHCTTVRNMAEGWGWTEETTSARDDLIRLKPWDWSEEDMAVRVDAYAHELAEKIRAWGEDGEARKRGDERSPFYMWEDADRAADLIDPEAQR